MLYLHGIGHFRPENVITNAFLAELDIGTDEEWITTRVGIRERRTVLPLEYIKKTKNQDLSQASKVSLYSNAQTGKRAMEHCLSVAGKQPKDIGLVIVGSCSPEHRIPAEACAVAAQFGLQCPAFDLNSACSTFIAQVHFLMNQKPETLPDYVMLVNPENNTRTINYTDRKSAVLWGDCTSAVLLSPRVKAPVRIDHSTFYSDPSGWAKVVIPSFGFFSQDGSSVQKFAILKTEAVIRELMGDALPSERVPYFIGHQANLLMLQSVVRRVQLPESAHLYNVDRFGNCGAAGGSSVLSENWTKFKAGDEIVLAAVGSGLSWGGLKISVGEIV